MVCAARLPTALPYDRILERLRREIGEPDIGAVKAISELPAELHRHFRAHFTRILDAFKRMDTDGDGLLSKAELVAAVAELGLPLSDDDATALWKAFDPDGVGSLTLKALDRTLRRAAADGGDDESAPAAALPRPPTVQTGRLATRRRSL